jgi:putative spermidine/putrescine transport system permease protein
MLAPHIVLAVGIFGFFAHLNLTGTTFGLVLAHSLIAVPFVYINVVARLQMMDENLEKAAASLGAGPIAVLFKVTLPNIMPSLVAGGAFAFITSWDEFIITLFTADAETQTLPIRIFSGVYHGVDVTAAAAAVVVMMGLVVGGIVYLAYDIINVKRKKL